MRRPRQGPQLRRRLEGAATRWIAALISAVLLAVIHAWWGGRIDPRAWRPRDRSQGEPTTLRGTPRLADGDTLTLSGVRIRLKGMDAPELAQSCEAAGETVPCGRRALAALAGLTADGVVCRGAEADRYGRLLALCTAGGEDVGAAMVRAGQAVAYGSYQTEEAEARAAGRGVWAGRFERPAEWRRERRQDGARDGARDEAKGEPRDDGW